MTCQDRTKNAAGDAVEQKRVDESLSPADVKYRRLYQSMRDAFVSVDMDGFILEYNESYRTMLGYEPEELLALRYADVTPEKWHRFEAEIVQNQIVPQGYSDIYEKEYRKKDGTILPVELRTVLISDDDNRPCGMWAIVRDITERKRIEEALKKTRDELEQRVEERTAELTEANEALRLSEEKYRLLMEACPDAVVMADPEMRIVFASRQAGRLYGSDNLDDIQGHRLVDFVAEEERPRVMANLPELFKSGLRQNREYTFLRKNGSRFPCEVSTAIVKDAAGQVRGVISVVRDLSELRQALTRLRSERQPLKHLLQSSDHERQLIAYEIHDDLAQQLAGAIMQFQTFQHLEGIDSKEAAKAYDAGMTMLRQGHCETRRLISGVRPPILDEEGVVAAVAHLVNEQNRQKGPKIEYRSRVVFDRLVPIVENAIYRIVQEALNNAHRHSKSEKVRVSLVQRDDRVQIEIRDWGIGFDASTIQENRFGLEGICQRVRLLDGTCRIQSKTGKGTRIVVELLVVVRE